MKLDVTSYNKMLSDQHILMIYSGPLWGKELDSMADMLQSRLDLEDMPLPLSQAVFSVFVEQMNNMMMYSEETVLFQQSDKTLEVPRGLMMLGAEDKTYFIQSGNVMKNASVPLLTSRLEHINSLDKKGLRQYYKEKINADDDNPDSKGAGLGLIEIARRATSKIEYEILPWDEGLSYFTMYVRV